MSLLVPIRAEAAKKWSATPGPISVSVSISPTDSIVHAGTALSIGVIAYDFDYWVESPNTGSSAGFLTQAWSTDSGYVSPGMLATWVLASDAKGLCTCLLTVDDSDSVFSPDTGSRNDPAVTHSFQVGVPTSAIAITKCDATAAVMHEINYTTTTYAATQQSLVLEYRENNSPYTSDWTAITATPELLSTTADSHQVATKTYKVMWNTLSLHNSHYEVRLRGTFYYPAFNETNSPQTSSYGVDIKNLDIAGSSPDYLVWASNGSVTPSAISATLSDNAGLTNTNITIDIYNSDRTTYPTPLRTVSTTCSNSSLTYQWNGNDNNGSPCPSGVYVYKITASHTQTGGTDTICDTSPTSLVNELNCAVSSSSIMSISVCTNTSIKDNTLYFFGPDLSLVKSKPANSPCGPFSDLTEIATVGTFSQFSVAGDYTILLQGNEYAPSDNDKSHKTRRYLGRSTINTLWAINVYSGAIECAGLTILTKVPDMCNKWLELVGYASVSGTSAHLFAKGWHDLSSTSYVVNPYGPTAQIFPPSVVLSGATHGQPIGSTVGSPSSKLPPSIWVIYGHGINDADMHYIVCNNDLNDPYLTSQTINSTSFSNSLSPYRLAVVIACNPGGGTNRTAQALLNHGWSVIYSSDTISNRTFFNFSLEFVALWRSSSYSCNLFPGTLSSVYSSVIQTLLNKPYDQYWDKEDRNDVSKVVFSY